ncbi:MAG: hypothetical protein KGQ46_07990 [Hyphomicrobiales bacterium]|nr:hypothetical protein [Hyphomicrobiales bacterium]MDE2115741.1 hypothetical protein [Hyphomicrobiales bacterium]
MQPNHLVLILSVWIWIVLPQVNPRGLFRVADLDVQAGNHAPERKADGPQSARKSPSYGDVCITEHGNCDMSTPAMIGGHCRCFIPGYGSKQGQVGH